MESVLVILRRAYLDITGNHCAAKLVEYFKHWREWKLKNHRTEWIYMPVRRIYEDLMEEHSVGIIRKAINKLLELGILSHRHNPGNGQDRTWQYKLNLGVLQSLVNQNEQAEVRSDNPMVKSDQCSTQDQSTNIKSTQQAEMKETFQQAESERVFRDGVSPAPAQLFKTEVVQNLDNYKEQLKLYGIYTHTWHNGKLVDNPKLKPVLTALTKIPRHRAERVIEAFLKWMRNKTEKQVCETYGSKYKALEVAISKGWE